MHERVRFERELTLLRGPVAQPLWRERDQAAPSSATGAGTAAEIGQNLDRIMVTTRNADLGMQPNFVGLNEIAPTNTPAKRNVFKALANAVNEASNAAKKLQKL